MTNRPRRRVKEHPNEFFQRIEARRREMVQEAAAQADALGLNQDIQCDLLKAIVWQECAERAGGYMKRTRMIFDWEMEAIQQDQTRGALEQLFAILREASDEYLADPDNYITATQAEASACLVNI